MITSISAALIPLFSSSERATFVDISDEASPSETTCLWLIPTLLLIHSSEVSTSFSKSEFVKTFSGT